MQGQEIADKVNKIISSLKRKKDKGYRYEAINWGDLRVVEVSIIQEIYPEADTRIEVLIEEAAPESRNFCENIMSIALEKHGLEINVRTEW